MSDELERVVPDAVRALRAIADVLEEAMAEPPAPAMVLYSQRDPRWRDEVYAGGQTFAQNGCLVCCVAMVASLAGYVDEPNMVARKLRPAGVFSGAFLSQPERIPSVYPKLRWDGMIHWRTCPADLKRLRQELALGPVIVEVEFRPGGPPPPADQHFVVAEKFSADGRDLEIADPWDGARTRLLERYALAHWDLKKAIYGLRLLRPQAVEVAHGGSAGG